MTMVKLQFAQCLNAELILPLHIQLYSCLLFLNFPKLKLLIFAGANFDCS